MASISAAFKETFYSILQGNPEADASASGNESLMQKGKRHPMHTDRHEAHIDNVESQTGKIVFGKFTLKELEARAGLKFEEAETDSNKESEFRAKIHPSLIKEAKAIGSRVQGKEHSQEHGRDETLESKKYKEKETQKSKITTDKFVENLDTIKEELERAKQAREQEISMQRRDSMNKGYWTERALSEGRGLGKGQSFVQRVEMSRSTGQSMTLGG